MGAMTKMISLILFCSSFVTFTLAADRCKINAKKEVWCNGLDQNYFDNEFKEIMENQTHITAIHIRNGTFTNIRANAFRSCKQTPSRELLQLKTLDLSGNCIKKISGKAFHCMKNLQKLNLSMNLWDVKNADHVALFNNTPKLRTLDLTNAFSTSNTESGKLHVPKLSEILKTNSKRLESLEVLRLGSNKLEFISDFYEKTLCRFPALHTIILSDNLLLTIDLNSSCHYRLKKLDLTNNSFNYFPPSTIKHMEMLYSASNQVSIYLYHQQWDCDCNIKPLHDWLRKTKINVVHKDDLRCYDGRNFNKTIMRLKDTEMLCDQPKAASSIQAGVVVMVVLLVIIGVAIVTGLFINRAKIQSCARNMYDPIRRGVNSSGDHVQYSSVDSTPVA